jgi:putative methionine-R-sulfoxide reductase with GAF domain
LKNDEEIVRLKQRVESQLKKKQRIIDNIRQHTEVFDADEALTRIMPAADTDFRSVSAYTELVLQNIAKELEIVQGLVFVLNNTDNLFHISGEYAYYSEERPRSFLLGETLSGQVAKNQKILNVKELPEGYITVLSGLGKSYPRHMIIVPIVHNNESIGIMEVASFKPFGENEELLLRKISESMANLLNELMNRL